MIEVKELKKTYTVKSRWVPGPAATTVEKMTARFRRNTQEVSAVNGLTFSISPGERVGFLGPNGAGKTTTLKMLSGLLHPTSGSVSVHGHVPQERKRAFLESIMLVMGQKQQLLWDLASNETFELNRAIYDVPRSQFRETVTELVELLDLGDLIFKPARELSLGERMKCELVAALVHRPKVLFMDEPTIGLDVTMQAVVRQFIKTYNQRYNATLILTSHDMDDVSALCPRLIVIDKGDLSYEGSLEDLQRTVKPEKRIEVVFSSPVQRDVLSSLAKVVHVDGSRAVLSVEDEQVKPVVSKLFETLPVVDIDIQRAPLEEVILEIFKRSKEQREKA